MSSTRLALPAISSPGHLVLEVLTGLHRGVIAPISVAGGVIGSLPGSDVVLADDGIAPDHMRLRCYGRNMAIDAVGGDVVLDRGQRLSQGRGCRVRLPVTLEIGRTRLRVSRPSANGSFLSRHGLFPVVVLAAVLLVSLFALRSGGIPFAGASEAPVNAAALDPVEVAAIPDPSASALEFLNGEIAGLGADGLAVAVDGPRVLVSGSLSQSDMVAWSGIRENFDRLYGDRFLLAGSVTALAAVEPPLFDLQAIWFGTDPYVLDGRGERRYPGAALADGWLLKTIERSAIVVTRDGHEFTLTL